MEGYQIKQSTTSRYEEYRNQMKKTKKSEEYRNRRSQQMVEAQRLLERNSNIHRQVSAADAKHLLVPSIYSTEKEYSNHDVLLTNGKNESEYRNDTIDEPSNGTKEGTTRLKSLKSSPKIAALGDERNSRESSGTSSKSKKNSGVQSESSSLAKEPSTRSYSDCPKVKELKQRMMIRKEKRRLRLVCMSEVPVSHQPIGNLMNDFHNRQREQDTTHRVCDDEIDVPDADHVPIRNNEIAKNLRVPSLNENTNDNASDNDDNTSVVDINLIYCHHCQRSYAPKTYEKFCTRVDEKGIPMCVSIRNKKRRVFNSAKMRIKNNTQLSSEEQQTAIAGRKKAVTDLRQKLRGSNSVRRSQKWREESESFRQAMETNRLIAKAEKEGKPSHYYL